MKIGLGLWVRVADEGFDISQTMKIVVTWGREALASLLEATQVPRAFFRERGYLPFLKGGGEELKLFLNKGKAYAKDRS